MRRWHRQTDCRRRQSPCAPSRRGPDPVGMCADLHLDAGESRSCPAAELVGKLPVGIGGETAAAVDGNAGREPVPAEIRAAKSSSRARRSQIALSMAETAIIAIPVSPRLRILAQHLLQRGGVAERIGADTTISSEASAQRLRCRHRHRCNRAPRVVPHSSCTSTIEVLSHENVPSASGASVGIV